MNNLRHITFFCCCFLAQVAFAQNTQWSLQQCLDYAHANNIQIKQADIRIQESELNKKQSVASLFPSISANTSVGLSRQNVKNSMNEYMSENSINGRYNVGASMSLFNGLKHYNSIKQNDLNLQLQGVEKENTIFNIDISIIRAYTQIAYLKEAVTTLQGAVASSKAQLELAAQKLKAGAISQSDYAQIEAQYSKDQYQLVLGENQLKEQILQLKQLLELGINESVDIAVRQVEEDEILAALPDKQYIYEQALRNLPSARYQQLSVESAELDYKIAAGGYFPTLSLSASVGTGNWFDADESFGAQLNDNLNESVSLSLSIPIFNGLQTHTSVQRAKLNRQSAALNKTAAEKELLSTIESLYNDAMAAQSQYRQAVLQLRAAETSHDLIKEQYRLGIKNAIELVVSDNDFLNASQVMLQTKYTAALAVKLLQYYQGNPIE